MRLLTTIAATCCLLVLPLAALAQQQANAVSTFHAGTSEWIAAYNAGEPERIVALYADDAVVMPPDAPAVSGRAALLSYFRSDIASSKEAGVTLAIEHVDGASSGDLGWHSGTFEATATGGAVVGTGKFLEVWERRNGKWLMVQDIWNNDAPPTAQASN